MNGEAHNVHKQKRNIQRTVDNQELLRHVDDQLAVGAVLTDEQAHQRLAEEVNRHKRKDAVDTADDGGCFQALIDAVESLRADVLPGESRHRRGERIKHAAEEHAQLAARRDRRDCNRADAVNGICHRQRANRRDGVLQAERDAHCQQTADKRRTDALVLRLHFEDGESLADDQQTPETADELADDGRPCRTLHAHVERKDECVVQHDVEQRGNRDGDNRRFAVAQRAHHAAAHVVQHRNRNREENRLDIGDRQRQNILRRVQHPQKLRRKEAGQQSHQHRNHRAQVHRVHHIAAHFRLVLRAERLRNRNREAGADAHAEAVDEEVQRSGIAHRRQRLRAQHAADDHGIHEAVQLLEQEAAQQRQGECQNQFQRRALRHVTGHVFLRHVDVLSLMQDRGKITFHCLLLGNAYL